MRNLCATYNDPITNGWAMKMFQMTYNGPNDNR